MRTKESLKVEIRTLMTEYARARAEMRRVINGGNTIDAERLAVVTHEILLSISHRQGLMVQILENEIEFTQPVKEVA